MPLNDFDNFAGRPCVRPAAAALDGHQNGIAVGRITGAIGRDKDILAGGLIPRATGGAYESKSAHGALERAGDLIAGLAARCAAGLAARCAGRLHQMVGTVAEFACADELFHDPANLRLIVRR